LCGGELASALEFWIVDLAFVLDDDEAATGLDGEVKVVMVVGEDATCEDMLCEDMLCEEEACRAVNSEDSSGDLVGNDRWTS